MSGEKFRGIFTIPTTPFTEKGEIDVESFKSVIDFCVDCGAHGLVYPVNASEFSTLSDDERLKMSEILVEHTAGRIPTVIGVQHLSAEVSARFAEHAREIGADSVIAMPPYAWKKPPSMDAIYDYYKAIAGAARIPVFVQNNPPPIGIVMSAEFLSRMCDEIEHIDYIKEETPPSTTAHTKLLDINTGSCKGVMGGAGGRYLIEEHRRGTCGQMPGCHVTDVVVALWEALESGDPARTMHVYKEISPLFHFEHQLPGTYKEVLKRRGVIQSAFKRNGQMPLDDIASKYLDELLKDLSPLMIWSSS
jgi:dihydrodipicolinate synthase/N-acetylneuraminate lyase